MTNAAIAPRQPSNRAPLTTPWVATRARNGSQPTAETLESADGCLRLSSS